MEQSKNKVYTNHGNEAILTLVPASARIVLDVGCGNGANARLLAARNCIVDGITISADEQQLCEVDMRNVFVHSLEDGLPLACKDQYDAVICSHVLEHICYPDKLMADIYMALKPGGVLVVALPNIMHYKCRWELLKGNFNYQPAGIWDYTHFRWYTFESARRFLVQSGFVVSEAEVTGNLPFNSFFKKIFTKKQTALLFQQLKKISRGFFGYQLLYSAHRM
jgi:methionine biosynthesis protein MetW